MDTISAINEALEIVAADNSSENVGNVQDTKRNVEILQVPSQARNTDEENDPKNCRYTTEKFNLWDRLFFGFITGIVCRGAKRQLEAKDLLPLHTYFTAQDTSGRILRLWKKKHAKQAARRGEEWQGAFIPRKNGAYEPKIVFRSEPSPDTVSIRPEVPRKPVNLISVVLGAFWGHFLFATVLYFFATLTALIPPFLIGRLEEFLSDENHGQYDGLYIAGALLVSQQLDSILVCHSFGRLFNIAIKIKSGFSSAIYQKCLRLSSRSSRKYPTGDIVNLISIDVENVVWAIVESNAVWGAPISVILIFVIIYQYLGVYSLAGAVAIVAFSPVLYLMTKLERSLQTKHMKKKDERVELVTEVFNNVKVIKLYAWENSFMRKIRELRKQECKIMYGYLGACNAFGFTWNCYPFFVSAAAIGAYMFLNKGGVLNPKIVLVSIAYFNVLRSDLVQFPYSVSLIAKAFVALKRIRDFLEADEVDPSIIKDDLEADEDIAFKNATLTWNDEESPVLRDLEFSVKKGELVAVVGSVAAGKSSLIQAIIGELNPTAGSISRRKSSKVAYVPQQAWILNDTIRNNILFGSGNRPQEYSNIVKKCCLLPDLEILPAGDSTEIGEKGVNLSGGQKQRVSLARAVYQDADIYLLDDPLSAVDAHVSYDLFKDVLGPEGILRKKTRVLVTHSVAILPHVDRIIVLEDGKITHQGTYDEMMRDSIRLKELVETHTRTEQDTPTNEDIPPLRSEEASDAFRKRTTSVVGTASNASICMDKQKSMLPSGRFVEKEEMQVGVVRWSVYFEFLWRFGVIGVFFTLAGYILSKVSDVVSLVYITNYSKTIELNNGTTTQADMWEHMQIYIAIGASQGLEILVGMTALALGCIWTSTSLHNKMLDAVMKAPMSFFDSTPTGRILNRFSRDVDELDVNLHGNANGCIETAVTLIVTLAWICVKLPHFVAIMVPFLLIFLGIQKFYVASSRQIKRLNAVTKSPVLNCFNESIAGTTSIRAYSVQDGFISKHMRLIDNNQNCLFHEYNGYRWLAVRLNVLGSLIDFGVCCMLIYSRGGLSSEMAALIFSLSLQASYAFTWNVRLGAQIENSLVSAERVLDYTKTKPEAPWYVKQDAPAEWPTRGEVCFEDYSTRYKENLDLVLRNVSFQIGAGEKVGIVGRTGAGKSSLTLALLRVIEAVEGKITIDGIDISKLGLNTLRSRLAIIPQDPVLFRGTLRQNVDPEDRFTDEEVRAALEKAHLKSDEKPLTHGVDEGGSNLSVGERQLVCLARALLRNSRLLILDEATAAVDLETDALIQKTIRQDFNSCTVITIAHRLHTIMDYDKIVVLDHGEIKELGSPKDLLQNPQGFFTSMAKDANIRVDT